MKTDRCREWRESLGMYALGHLQDDERAGLEAHLEGCPECRAEVQSLSNVAALLPHGDPERFEDAPEPSAELGRKIFAAVSADQKAERRKRRRRFRLSLAGGTATAVAVAALLALVVLPAGTDGGEANPQLPPKQKIEFASLPQGVGISATLVPHAFGTEIHMYVSGVRSGTLCKVFLRGPDGSRYPAGSFRYRWGDDSEAVLSSALDLSRTEAIGVHAGDQTFIAPVERSTAAVSPTKQSKEDAT